MTTIPSYPQCAQNLPYSQLTAHRSVVFFHTTPTWRSHKQGVFPTVGTKVYIIGLENNREELMAYLVCATMILYHTHHSENV